jgi:phospholipid transport system substrate-binding protein
MSLQWRSSSSLASRRAVRRSAHALVLCALLAWGHTPALAQESPEQVIDRTVQEAFRVLRDPNLKADRQARMAELRRVVDRAFDWEAMARSSLGAPWRQLDAAQRKEFVGVFKELLAERYRDDIDRFEGSEQIQVKSAERSGELAIVKTVLITSSREQVPMDYTLHPVGPTWQVEDVTIEQVSMVNHYRKTFARYLANHTFAELMQQLTRRQRGSAPEIPK